MHLESSQLLQLTFLWYRGHQTSTCTESTGPRCDTCIYSQCSAAAFSSLVTSEFSVFFKISLLTYKTLPEIQPVYLSPCLTHCVHPVHWEQTTIIVCRFLGSRPTQAQVFHPCAPSLGLKPPAVCPFSQFSCYLQETSEATSLWLGLPIIDTSTPDGPFMLRICFIDFAVEHRFGYRAPESDSAGDIGATELDWLIDWMIMVDISVGGRGRVFLELWP